MVLVFNSKILEEMLKENPNNQDLKNLYEETLKMEKEQSDEE